MVRQADTNTIPDLGLWNIQKLCKIFACGGKDLWKDDRLVRYAFCVVSSMATEREMDVIHYDQRRRVL